MPARGFLLLSDPDSGCGLGIGRFETEEDLRKREETLSSMSPPGEGMGHRASVETYEVAVDIRQ